MPHVTGDTTASNAGGNVGGEDVAGVPVEVLADTVIARGRAGIGVPGAFRSQSMQLMPQAQPALTWLCSTVLHMAKAARVLASTEAGRVDREQAVGFAPGARRGGQQRIWAYHDGVDLGGPGAPDP